MSCNIYILLTTIVLLQVLIGYNRGLIVLWDIKENNADQTYNASQVCYKYMLQWYNCIYLHHCVHVNDAYTGHDANVQCNLAAICAQLYWDYIQPICCPCWHVLGLLYTCCLVHKHQCLPTNLFLVILLMISVLYFYFFFLFDKLIL